MRSSFRTISNGERPRPRGRARLEDLEYVDKQYPHEEQQRNAAEQQAHHIGLAFFVTVSDTVPGDHRGNHEKYEI